MKPLEGLKVIDLSRVLAGPYCTMLLADMGAEVIKIERPEIGDDSRQFGPFIKNMSAYFVSINRNKKSITLNLKTQKGKEIFKELVRKADVVVENFRPGTMDKLGLGYEELKQINKGIIYAACSGFGHTGPFSPKPAYDLIVQAMGGIMSITGQPNGTPTKVGASIGDIFAGTFTAIGILAALHHREKTGIGQKVDVAMLDCQVAILENAIARYLTTGVVPEPIGNRHPSITPFEAFKTKDDYIIIAVGNDTLWERFCHVIDRQDLLEDNRFKTNKLRTENHMELYKILQEIFVTRTTGEWFEILDAKGIPCSQINNIKDVVDHPQIKAREMLVDVEQPGVGKFQIPNLPIKFSATPGGVEQSAPALGEHTEDVLSEYLNYDFNKIQQLKEQGVV